ncbi:MAG TPA: response regulator [Usitatibacteraceae bacterium]
MKGLSKANILVVDDEPQTLVAMQELLSQPDRDIVLARSGEEALRKILKVDFALILLDIRMPGIDGFETAALVRGRIRSRHTPIIFLTAALEDMQSMFRGYEVGAVDYILKPVHPDVLKSKVAIFADLYDKTAQLSAQIARRKAAERELSRLNEDLEFKVRERTTSLISVNERLRKEIDARKQTESELYGAKIAAEAANLAKSTFLANMSHEIRTPMNAIIGMTELALEASSSSEQRDYLGIVKTSCDSLLTIVNDILDFSKIEAGHLEIETVPFSLRDCVGDALKALAHQAHSKGLELVSNVATEAPDALLGDPGRLRQILLNIAGNAIKFTEHGEVVVTVEVQSADDGAVFLQFMVRDTGTGISDDKQRAIFEPFLQGDSSTTRVFGGTGLGLTISARLVRMMDGRIWVESQPGKGSTFYFTVHVCAQKTPPIRSARAIDGNQGDLYLPLATAAQKKRLNLAILVVEDNQVNRRLAQHVLEKAGHRVVAVDCGAAAIAETAQRTFDLILMDVQMPGVDGIETTAAIRKSEIKLRRRTPIIALTANATVVMRERCKQAGMDGYLTKPIRPAMLIEAVEQARTGSPEVAPDIIDRAALMERVGGDPRLLAEIVDIFVDNCDKILVACRSAFARRDVEKFAQDLHTLHGMMLNLGAGRAQGLIENLQASGPMGERGKVMAGFETLEREMQMLKIALCSLAEEAMPSDGVGVSPKAQASLA